MKRRDFLKYIGMGASVPFLDFFRYKKKAREYLTPFVFPPDEVIPGLPNWYASVCRQCPAGCGIHVKLREGHAIKIEGNPLFPINQGKLCARGQAGLQVLYNPDRVRGPLARRGKKEFRNISWKKALATLSSRMREIRETGASDGVVFLTHPLRGNLGKLITTFMEKYGSDKIFSHEFLNDDALITANELCFGHKAIPDYDVDNAKYILSFGADFLDSWVSPVRYSVGYGQFRDRPVSERGWLIHFEPRLSLTGANADEWFSIKPESEGLLALGIAHVIMKEGLYHPSLIGEEAEGWRAVLAEYEPERVADRTGVSSEEITRIAKEFALSGPSLALCGGSATAQTNGVFNAMAANILNYLVGSVGEKGGVRFSPPAPFAEVIEENLSYQEMLDLAEKMEAGEVKILFLYNVNPVFNLPESAHFAKALKKVPLVVSFSSFRDDSTELADLVLPDHTYLESWGDYIPLVDNGRRTIGIMQPMIRPLYNTRSIGDTILSLAKALGGEVLSALPQNNFLAFLKDSWKSFYEQKRSVGAIAETSFEKFFDRLLQQGGWFEEKSASLPSPKLPTPAIFSAARFRKPDSPDRNYPFSLCPYPSGGLYDGRGANQPWLQELPEPLVSATWDSWVEIGPKTAKEMGIEEGDLLWVESPAGKVKTPAYINQAVGPGIIAVPLGQGHTTYGRYAKDRGENLFKIIQPLKEPLSGSLAWASTKVKISKAGGNRRILKIEAYKQVGLEDGVRQMGREIVETVTPEEAKELEHKKELEPIKALPTRDLRKGTRFLSQIGLGKFRKSKYHQYKYRWGMVIDLDKCTGCEACVVACRAENNVPWAGPKEMYNQGDIFWIRVERYWEGKYPEIQARLIPMPCYHCGNAPCEPVCPVYAPYHTVDGLNAQVYNRCIGTRFCGVNCPYKVRYFNFFNPEWPKPLDKQLNPDLSVRPQGVMEKCTFCVQRLRAAKDKAKDEGRLVRDGEVYPACVQTCPSNAMTFGNLMDPNSRVSRLTRNPRRYRVLEELNTEPAVIYLKAVKKHVPKTRWD